MINRRWGFSASLLLGAIILGGCRGATPELAARPILLPFAADTNRVEMLAPGVTRRYIHSPEGPWGIHVLDVDLSRCYSAVAVKSGAGAAGRTKTSVMLQNLAASTPVIGGVNADFFSLSGFQGIPTGALITRGRVITGPFTQPVLAIDSAGMPRALVLRLNGSVTIGPQTLRLQSWNRPAPAGLALYDASWGRALDTASSTIEVVREGRVPSRIVRIDTTTAGMMIPADGAVIVVGRTAPPLFRHAFLSLKVGDTLRASTSIEPFHPLEAVGGRPMLARDSVIVAEVDTEGQASFQARNPRTAVGIANNGARLILVVIDGRQKPYSDGTTLRETAMIMLALGARDAINLDGGGSSALVYADPAKPGEMRVANRPSDATGERAVGDALAIVRGCNRG